MSALIQKLKAVNFKEDFINFPLYIISRPFKGFGDLKYEDRGSPYFAFAMMVLLCLFNICDSTYKGFIITGYYSENMVVNTPYVLIMTIAPVILFVLGNWSVTTITNGSGSLKQIFMVYAYASFPKLILDVIGLVLSNVVTAEEAAFSTFFYAFGTVAFMLYLFIGLVMIHEYTFTKSLLMVILTILAMCIIVFVLSLFITLTNEVFVFFSTVFKEIAMRF